MLKVNAVSSKENISPIILEKKVSENVISTFDKSILLVKEKTNEVFKNKKLESKIKFGISKSTEIPLKLLSLFAFIDLVNTFEKKSTTFSIMWEKIKSVYRPRYKEFTVHAHTCLLLEGLNRLLKSDKNWFKSRSNLTNETIDKLIKLAQLFNKDKNTLNWLVFFICVHDFGKITHLTINHQPAGVPFVKKIMNEFNCDSENIWYKMGTSITCFHSRLAEFELGEFSHYAFNQLYKLSKTFEKDLPKNSPTLLQFLTLINILDINAARPQGALREDTAVFILNLLDVQPFSVPKNTYLPLKELTQCNERHSIFIDRLKRLCIPYQAGHRQNHEPKLFGLLQTKSFGYIIEQTEKSSYESQKNIINFIFKVNLEYILGILMGLDNEEKFLFIKQLADIFAKHQNQSTICGGYFNKEATLKLKTHLDNENLTQIISFRDEPQKHIKLLISK